MRQRVGTTSRSGDCGAQQSEPPAEGRWSLRNYLLPETPIARIRVSHVRPARWCVRPQDGVWPSRCLPWTLPPECRGGSRSRRRGWCLSRCCTYPSGGSTRKAGGRRHSLQPVGKSMLPTGIQGLLIRSGRN